ncbi:MAG: type IX secretion system outer membrane channel protein PorV [Prolixibacteraceae bacterium]|nr:type IX secretion system outer membrane channel protein PorV [Prolixibacteraceae bacterium]MBT6767357.1 type IX secretion system outer membrane channel protein PorV [Prolixibacteraceae bacterium]MBT6997877.1 type IX secretion system outer membrane channel protein PorV [Prolixibacteraceae bacterium]MBT7394044.1 type IX secretion system outer membrane channel protein PorV [Prolixibacteraceae bacterium]
MRLLFVIALIVTLSESVNAQATTSGANTITTAVPFLSITPDSRAGGMGDVGVGTSPDVSSQHWNPAKYAFIESDMGVGLSYSPWLRALVNDINLAYIAGYKKLDEVQTISSSLRYFSLGDIVFTSEYGEYMGQQSPNEFALDLGYTRLLSEIFSGAVALRYIRSDLTGGQLINGIESNAGSSFAADVAFYLYNEFRANRRENIFSAGINIQNIGAKISYTDGEVKDFIPTTLKLGASYTTEMDEYNSITFAVEANKLLVPTPPIDTLGFDDGDVIYPGGINSDISPISGIFSSFADAPGGLSEELQEINLSVGVEYWYNKQFALRAGYFYEHENKGNRKFLTAGAGLRLNVFALDFSYLLPTQRNHPLENTLRFTLSFDVDAFGNQR